jgi:sulfatase maturation enzyme AslB (radical SAM superfamily)
VFRSVTTNGLLLNEDWLDRLAIAAPDKVNISIHFPDSQTEVERVITQVGILSARGINSGVNFLVTKSNLSSAITAAATLHQAGIGNDQIVYLPMRGQDTPTPQEMAQVAGSKNFQSMTCLLACAKSPRFCSVDWDRQVGWCSYTTS